MYQALSRFTVLQAMGSWAGAWERGYDCTTDDDLCVVIEMFGDQYFVESVLASVVL